MSGFRPEGPQFGLSYISGSVSGSGNNVLLTPASGRKLRVYYAAYNNFGGLVEAAFRFGASGPLWLRNNLSQTGCVIAKDFHGWFVEGAVDESLILNLSAAVGTIWNAFYVEA